MLEEPSSMLLSQHMALSILPSIRCRKASPKNDVFTSMLHGWDGVLGVLLIVLLLPPPNTASRSKKLFFSVSSDHMTFSSSSSVSSRGLLANFRRA